MCDRFGINTGLLGMTMMSLFYTVALAALDDWRFAENELVPNRYVTRMLSFVN